MEKKILIDGKYICESTTIEEMCELQKYRIFKSGPITRLNSAPNTVEFMGKEYLSSLVFQQEKLVRIFLRPIISGVKAPNYPDENYQELKWNYNVGVLEGAYGTPSEKNDLAVLYRLPGILVISSKIVEGKDKYTGGNIEIIFER